MADRDGQPGQAGRLGCGAAGPALIPDNHVYEPVAQAGRLLEFAVETPKSMKWKLRANVGDRVRWYELPEEVAH